VEGVPKEWVTNFGDPENSEGVLLGKTQQFCTFAKNELTIRNVLAIVPKG